MKHRITKQSIKGDGSITSQKTYEDFNKKKPEARNLADAAEPPVAINALQQTEPLETSLKVQKASKDKVEEKPHDKK
jgi:hypothetical protein